jgi:hypothetical protein
VGRYGCREAGGIKHGKLHQQCFQVVGRFWMVYTKIPGVLFGLGAGTGHPELHSSDYDFPDELIAPV